MVHVVVAFVLEEFVIVGDIGVETFLQDLSEKGGIPTEFAIWVSCPEFLSLLLPIFVAFGEGRGVVPKQFYDV